LQTCLKTSVADNYTVYNPNRGDGFLVNDQRDAQFFAMYLSLFLTLYMFQAHHAHHQDREMVSIQPLAAVTLKIGG